MAMFIAYWRPQFLKYTDLRSLIFEGIALLGSKADSRWLERDVLFISFKLSLYFEAFTKGNSDTTFLVDIGRHALFLFVGYFFDYMFCRECGE
jgi:hypothetical protein